MSWRILKIGIYSRATGALRALTFSLTGLNIITGPSGRGKSAILDIVNYCLLSTNCPIAKGIIRAHVSHVGIVLTKNKNHFVIVRPLPEEGRLTSQQVYINNDIQADLPVSPPETRWNVEAAREELSDFTGIESLPVLGNTETTDPDTRTPANIRHCSFYIFQPQDVIASRSLLFSGVEDAFKKRHASDAAYYFLGILTLKRLQKRRQLRKLYAEKNALERRIREQARLKVEGFGHGLQLWGEAVALGILNGNTPPPSTLPALAQDLRKISTFSLDALEKITKEAGLGEIQEKEAEVRKTLRQKKLELAAIDRFSQDISNNQRVTDKQLSRLELRKLLPNSNENDCPVCGNKLHDATHIDNIIEDGIRALNAVRLPPKRISGKVQQGARKLQEEIERLEELQTTLQAQLKTLFSDWEKNRALFEEAGRKERLVGKVGEYLSSVERMETPLDAEAHELSSSIKNLEAEVGDAAIRSIKRELESALGEEITQLARRLQVEFPNSPVRIDFVDFAIEIEFDRQWVRLAELGSGANWVGYHIAATVGLHKFFLRANSPVPSVLMLDQPSQAWFPAESAKLTRETQPKGNTELEAVRRIYKLLHAESQGIKSPQIIAVDHAKLEDPWFSNSIIANWHEAGALVPDEWIS